MQIRPMAELDIPQVFQIELETALSPWTQFTFKSCIAIGYSSFVVEIEAEVVAFAILNTASEEAHIMNIAVSPKFQSQGIGSTLFKLLLDESKISSCSSIILEVAIDNKPAIHVYEKFGFQKIGLRKAYYNIPNKTPKDAFVYSLDL